MTIEIHVLDENGENLFIYLSSMVPRKGEHLTVQNDKRVFKVKDVEHFVRPHGGTGSLISPYVTIFVSI